MRKENFLKIIILLFFNIGFVLHAEAVTPTLKINPPENVFQDDLISVPIVGSDFSEETDIVGLQFEVNYDKNIFQFVGYEESISYGVFTIGENENSLSILWDNFPTALKLNNENFFY